MSSVNDSVVAARRLERVRRFAVLLDNGIRIPGTRIRIGLDPILGLLPGLGDAAGAVLSTSIFAEGIRRGASRATLLRMAANIMLDLLLGAIPILGDVFDVVMKSNLRNVALLERQAANPQSAARSDRLFVVLLSAALFLVGAALLAVGVALPIWLLSR
jgi:hypothetical protein